MKLMEMDRPEIERWLAAEYDNCNLSEPAARIAEICLRLKKAKEMLVLAQALAIKTDAIVEGHVKKFADEIEKFLAKGDH